jgi:HAD superfamily hydrolase (TIGR01509 family)
MTTLPTPRAVVFDLDGTLIDTENLFNTAGVAACASLGLPVDRAFFESLAGVHDVERARRISTHVGRDMDVQAFFDSWDARAHDLMARDGVPLKPGATDLLAHLHGLGLPLALCTSSRRGPALEKLSLSGLARWFSAVITVDDVAHAKPAPDPYLLACMRLGTTPAQTAAFEDSDTGAAAAMAAGLTVVQVPDIHPTDGRHAHLVAPDLISGARALGVI